MEKEGGLGVSSQLEGEAIYTRSKRPRLRQLNTFEAEKRVREKQRKKRADQ